MTPKFNSTQFMFAGMHPANYIEYIEGDPTFEEKDPGKIWIEGKDNESGNTYPLAIDIDGFTVATLLVRARREHLIEEARQHDETIYIGMPR